MKKHKTRKLMHTIKSILPHFIIVPSGMLIVLFVIDRLNPHVYFMANEFHKWLLLIVCVLGITESILFLPKAKHTKKGAKHGQKTKTEKKA